MTTPGDLLTIGEVQSLLKVSRATVYELMAARGLPRPLKIGRCNRWPRLEVEGWIEAQPRAHVQVREETATVAYHRKCTPRSRNDPQT